MAVPMRWALLGVTLATADVVNRSHFLGKAAVQVTAAGPKCGPLDAPENSHCKEAQVWTKS